MLKSEVSILRVVLGAQSGATETPSMSGDSKSPTWQEVRVHPPSALCEADVVVGS